MSDRAVRPCLRTAQDGHTHPICPRCGAELCNGLIINVGKRSCPDNPEAYARLYGWPCERCFSSVIGIEISGCYDGVSEWLYPCCGLRVDRFSREDITDE